MATLREQIAQYVQHKEQCEKGPRPKYAGGRFLGWAEGARCSCGLDTLLASLDPRQDETGYRQEVTRQLEGIRDDLNAVDAVNEKVGDPFVVPSAMVSQWLSRIENLPAAPSLRQEPAE